MNTKRKVKDYIGQNVAIYCSSKEEWDKIVDLFDSPTVKKHYWEDVVNLGKSDTISITGRWWNPKEHFIKKQYTIYPASDFLKEGKPFNTGDLVYLEKHYKHETENKDYSTHLYLNKPLTVKSIKLSTNIFGNKNPEWTVYFVEDSHGYGHPACKFKLWQNTTPEYIEILHECHTYTQKGRIYKVLSWESENCWVVCNVKCGSYEPDSRLCIDDYYENKSWWRPSTKEAYDLQNETKMLPYPTDEKYFKAVVTKDIHREHISTKGSIPKLIPKGYQTWFDNKYLELIENKKENEVVRPENNRWSANIPAEYFEIVEDKKAFKFEEGKWYSFNWDWYSSNSPVIAKIKKVFGNSINVSWRSYLWEENNYDTSDTYLFKDISNIKELSIEQVQPYLPEGHPDKFKVETPINNTPFKVGDYITVIGTKSEFIGDVLKITEIIDEGKNYGLWFKHIPESFSGGGFRYNAYKDKIRRSTPEEVKNSLIVSQYPLTSKQCFEAKPLIKNRNPVVKETIKNRNRLEIKPIKQTIKLKHYVNI